MSKAHLRDLKPDALNARKHSVRNVGMIERSIQSEGFGRAILLANDGTVIAGNATIEAAASAGIENVRVIESDGTEVIAVKRTDVAPDSERFYKLAIADNRAAELASWDIPNLQQVFDAGVDGAEFWFPEELSALFAEAEAETPAALTDPDAVPLPPKEPITKPGDLWLLGRHRLLCGDATVVTDVDRLMNGQRAELTLTDPPYNVGIDYGTTTNDKNDNYPQFSRDWLTFCPSDGIVFTPGMVNLPMWYAIQPPKWVCAWRKSNQNSNSGIGGFNTWEPLLVYGKLQKRVGHDSWDMPVQMHADDIGHPVPKSADAWRAFVEDFSTDNALIYDPFLGSGTTVIASEQTGRTCYGMEISPAYCDVIINRWQDFTGQTATFERRAD